MLDFEPAFKKGLEQVEWLGRFQTLEKEPLIILDGAHNPSAARALVQSLKELYSGWEIGFIFGFLEDKEIVAFFRVLKPFISKAWSISITAERGVSSEVIVEQARLAGVEVVSVESVSKGWNTAKAWATESPNRLVCITGSLYLNQELMNKS